MSALPGRQHTVPWTALRYSQAVGGREPRYPPGSVSPPSTQQSPVKPGGCAHSGDVKRGLLSACYPVICCRAPSLPLLQYLGSRQGLPTPSFNLFPAGLPRYCETRDLLFYLRFDRLQPLPPACSRLPYSTLPPALLFCTGFRFKWSCRVHPAAAVRASSHGYSERCAVIGRCINKSPSGVRPSTIDSHSLLRFLLARYQADVCKLLVVVWKHPAHSSRSAHSSSSRRRNWSRILSATNISF